MLTDTKIKSLKPKEKIYKVVDRDGLYVAVLPSGSLVFHYDYRANGRRETLTISRYGADGISLTEDRERLMVARKQVSEGNRGLQGILIACIDGRKGFPEAINAV